MAPLSAILNALRRAVARDLGTFGSLKLNNFFLFIALLIWGALESGVEPKSAEPLLLLLFLVLLVPLSSDPLQKIPPVRLSVWPLGAGQRLVLRLASHVRSRQEERFRPHMTLCRFAPAARVTVDEPLAIDPFEVNAIRLMRSTLAPAGAQHHEISRCELGA